MYRRLLEPIAELIAEPPLQKSFDSGSSFSETFLEERPEEGRQSQHGRPQERERIRCSNSWANRRLFASTNQERGRSGRDAPFLQDQ